MNSNNTINIGSVLLADPTICDDNFKEAVLLLTELEDDGIYGFTLNRKMALLLHEIIDEITVKNIDVFYGGPAGLDTMQFIHNAPDIFVDASLITNGIYFGGDFNLLIDAINNNEIKPHQFKIFMGYCGWDIEQLLTELYEEESWLITSLNEDDILKQNTNDMYNDCKTKALG